MSLTKKKNNNDNNNINSKNYCRYIELSSNTSLWRPTSTATCIKANVLIKKFLIGPVV